MFEGLVKWRKSKDGRYNIAELENKDNHILFSIYDNQLENYTPLQQARNFDEIKEAYVNVFRSEKTQKHPTFVYAEKFDVHILGEFNPKKGQIFVYQKPLIKGNLAQFKS